MNNTKFYNFYGTNVGIDINEPHIFLNLIEHLVPKGLENLRHIVVSPYCYFYLKPMLQKEPFSFTSETESLLLNAGVVGKITEPFQTTVVNTLALPPSLIFFVAYENAKSLTTAYSTDKFLMSLMQHITGHIEAAQSVIALRQELRSL